MSDKAIRPSTLDGIKRLAKTLKIQKKIPHTQALDDAAQAAGFQNFRHAGNVLRSARKKERNCLLWATCFPDFVLEEP